MNWMQAYEVIACGALAMCCVAFNLAMHSTPRVTRMCIALLGVSSLIRCGALIAKYAGIASVGKPLAAAADGNIPILTAIVLASIVWQQIRARVVRDDDYERGSSDAR